MPLYDRITFADVVILVGGDDLGCILNVTEELAEWGQSYCILDYFSLSFFLREWLAFLYSLIYWLELFIS